MGVSLLVNFIMRFCFRRKDPGKTRTTFPENMYDFSRKHVLIINVLYTVSFLRAYCTEFYWGSLYSSLAKTDG